MMKGVIIPILAPILVMVTWCAGCHAPAAMTEATVAQVRAPDAAEFDRLWTAIGDVLRDHNLRPDRQDRRDGVITSHPTTAQQFFEFWRSDTYGAYEHAEANLQTLRKSTVVKLGKSGEAGEYSLDVQVNVQRLSQEERRMTSAGGALRVFNDRTPTTLGTSPGPEYWVDLGRDGKLESRLLHEILNRYGEPLMPIAADARKSSDRESDTAIVSTTTKPPSENE